MIVHSKDGTFFVYLEQCKNFRYTKIGENEYAISADEMLLGKVETKEEAERVLRGIVFDFKIASVECDPW